jgi:hypothetical protein
MDHASARVWKGLLLGIRIQHKNHTVLYLEDIRRIFYIKNLDINSFEKLRILL